MMTLMKFLGIPEAAPKKTCPDPFADKVKCDECKHWIDKKDSSTVRVFGSFHNFDFHYCPTHKKPYDIMHTFRIPILYQGVVYMDEFGTPIGYEKIKEKK